MKKIILLLLLTISQNIFSQNVGIGTSNPKPYAKLDISSSNSGLLVPRTNPILRSTLATMMSVINPAQSALHNGLMVYDVDINAFFVWNSELSTNGRWVKLLDNTDSLNDLDSDTLNEIQSLSYSKPILSLSSNGGTINLSDLDNGDIQKVTAGDGLVGGADSGIAVLNVVATNGLTDYANDIKLGGDLIENTTITLNHKNINFELNGAGLFQVKDGANQILKIDGAENTYISGSTFYVSGTQNRVGIGTISPQSKLHVNGGRVEFTGITDATGTAGTGVLEIANSLRLDGNEIITNTNSILYLQKGNNGDLNIDNNSLFVDASSNEVGIGTTSPVAKLHVNDGRVEFTASTDASGTAGTGVLEIANSLRIDGNEIITNTNTTLSLQHDNNGDLKVDNGTFFVDASSDKVGIKTVTPSEPLDIDGNVHVRNGHQILFSSDNSNKNMAVRTSGENFQIVESDDSNKIYLQATDQGVNGVTDLPMGIRTQRQYYHFSDDITNGDDISGTIGNFDLCYLTGVHFKNTGNISDEDDDYQCFIYSDDLGYTSGPGTSTGTDNYSYSTRPTWKIKYNCLQDCSYVQCGAICVNFDF